MLDIVLTIILFILGIINTVLCALVINDEAASAKHNIIFSIGIVVFNVVVGVCGFVSEYGKNLRLVGTSAEKEAHVALIVLSIVMGILVLLAVWTSYNDIVLYPLFPICGVFLCMFIMTIPMSTLARVSLPELKQRASSTEEQTTCTEEQTDSVSYNQIELPNFFEILHEFIVRG